MANRNNNLNATDKAIPEPLIKRKALLENSFHQFGDDLIGRAERSGVEIGPHLRHLNQIAVLCAGASMVMRIVGANDVVDDNYDEKDPDSEPPLSRYAVGVLTNMVSEICEMIGDGICVAANKLSAKVPE